MEASKTESAMHPERRIRALGGPRSVVLPEDVAAEVDGEFYFTAADGYLGMRERTNQSSDAAPSGLRHVVFCVLTLRNGMRVVGVDEGPLYSGLFEYDEACELAREDAVKKLRLMLGFLMRQSAASGSFRSLDAALCGFHALDQIYPADGSSSRQ